MLMYKCLSENTVETRKMFLDLPKRIYTQDCPQDFKVEQQILEEKHILSSEIKAFPYIMLNNNNGVVCRCMLIYYKNDDTAYLGFFEAHNNVIAVKEMFEHIRQKAYKDGKTMLLGPINASIYIGYRFKTNNFDKRTYTGEPYNKNYYPRLWEQAGFEVSDKYVSNKLREIEETDIDEKLEALYNRFVEKGYEFTCSDKKMFKTHMEQIYELMMKTYTNFTGYKELSKEEFFTIYASMEKVLNYDMVKLCYKDGELKAFCVCVPNYGGLLHGGLSIEKFFKILSVKKNPEEYVILYLGADSGSAGLGGAMIHLIRNELYERDCTAIGALIKEGNVTGKMYQDLYVDQYTYALYSRNTNQEIELKTETTKD